MATKKITNETYTCTNKGDTVYCISGNNTVYGGKSNDKIYGGSGADTFVTGTIIGKDSINKFNSADTLKISTGIGYFDEIIKSGNNLVFNSYQHKNGKMTNKVIDKITIVDYFKADKGKSINEKDRITKITDVSTPASLLNQGIGVYLKGTQNLGKGKFYLYTGKSNSTVVLDKTSEADIMLLNETVVSHNKTYSKFKVKRQAMRYGLVEKKGNDLTVKYDNLTIDVNKVKEKVSSKTNSITFKDYFSTDVSSAGRGKSGIAISDISYKSELGSNTMKKFIEESDIVITASDLKEGDFYRFDSIDKSIIDASYIVLGSKKNDRVTISNTKDNMIDSRGGNDVVHTEAGGSKTRFYYSSGKDNYIAGLADDQYVVGATIKSFEKGQVKITDFTKNSSLLVNDKGGNEDEMFVAAKTKDLRLFFDVNKNGDVVVSEEMDFLRSDGKIWDSLLIFNKSAFTGKNIQKMAKNKEFSGAVEIDNYFANGTSSSAAVSKTTRGAGCIEFIGTKNDEELDMKSWINKIASDVASWLSDNKYNTAGEVFSKENNSKDINALIAVYNKDTYASCLAKS